MISKVKEYLKRHDTEGGQHSLQIFHGVSFPQSATYISKDENKIKQVIATFGDFTRSPSVRSIAFCEGLDIRILSPEDVVGWETFKLGKCELESGIKRRSL